MGCGTKFGITVCFHVSTIHKNYFLYHFTHININININMSSFIYVLPGMSLISSVASFLLWGGGGKTPKCTDRRKKNHVYVTYICIFRSPNASAYIYTINAVVWHYKWQYNWQTLTLRRKKYASELRKILHLLILKLLFPSIFCWYFRYFVSETYLFSGLQLHCIHYTINHQCSFLSLLMVWHYNIINSMLTKH